MTKPLAITASTPIASSNCVQTPNTAQKQSEEIHLQKKKAQGVNCTNVVCFPGHEASLQPHHLDGVQSDFKDVVDESEQWRQRERCHKYGGETELDHCETETK